MYLPSCTNLWSLTFQTLPNQLMDHPSCLRCNGRNGFSCRSRARTHLLIAQPSRTVPFRSMVNPEWRILFGTKDRNVHECAYSISITIINQTKPSQGFTGDNAFLKEAKAPQPSKHQTASHVTCLGLKLALGKLSNQKHPETLPLPRQCCQHKACWGSSVDATSLPARQNKL